MCWGITESLVLERVHSGELTDFSQENLGSEVWRAELVHSCQ